MNRGKLVLCYCRSDVPLLVLDWIIERIGPISRYSGVLHELGIRRTQGGRRCGGLGSLQTLRAKADFRATACNLLQAQGPPRQHTIDRPELIKFLSMPRFSPCLSCC